MGSSSSREQCHYFELHKNRRRVGYKSSQLMLCREIIAVCSQIHTKHINTLCGQNVELLNVKCPVRTAQ